ncbi:MAG TPA: prepilin-type N-terminal cleavage/methylation domain-containing protein [Tepidisphaeraceae bacterium]|jgi:prepilin-type N-terminal cleavage/methylation domain-containing protein|nr:prepilin-type N-terminal cleavage/methylation domain-containing protein [Tepidisphaeraceae bacterium]
MMATPSIHRRGFTLIEVLVTLVLIGIVLPAIMHGVTVAMAAGDSARHRNEATELAKSELAQIIAGSQWSNATNLSGDFSPDWPGYQWKATVYPWDQDTSGMGIQQIDLTVTWQERGHPESLTLTTLAYPRGQTT